MQAHNFRKFVKIMLILLNNRVIATNFIIVPQAKIKCLQIHGQFDHKWGEEAILCIKSTKIPLKKAFLQTPLRGGGHLQAGGGTILQAHNFRKFVKTMLILLNNRVIATIKQISLRRRRKFF